MAESRGATLASLTIAGLALIGSFFVPEVRRLFRLEHYMPLPKEVVVQNPSEPAANVLKASPDIQRGPEPIAEGKTEDKPAKTTENAHLREPQVPAKPYVRLSDKASAIADDLSGGLVAYWSFDDGTASDISNHGHNGVILGHAQMVDGVRGRALRFSGGSSIIVAGDDLGVTPTLEKTIALWVRPDSINGDGVGLISKYRHFNVSQSNFYARLSLAGGQLLIRLTGNGTNVVDVKAGQIGEWQHLVFVMKDPVTL